MKFAMLVCSIWLVGILTGVMAVENKYPYYSIMLMSTFIVIILAELFIKSE